MHTKSIIFGVLAAVFGAPFWLFYKDAIDFVSFDGLEALYALAFLTLHLMCIAVLLLFAERLRYITLPFFVAALPMVYVFGPAPAVFITLLFAVGAVSQGYAKTQDEMRSRINFKITMLLREGLPIILTAFSIMLAVGYFFETARASRQVTVGDIFPRSLFLTILQHIPYLGNNILPGFDKDTTVNEYITLQLQSTGVNLSLLPERDRERILEEMRSTLFKDMALVKGNEKLGDVFYNIVMAQSTRFLDPYQQFIPFALAIGFFLFLRTVAFPYGWMIIFCSLGVVKILNRAGFLVRTEEHSITERIHWA